MRKSAEAEPAAGVVINDYGVLAIDEGAGREWAAAELKMPICCSGGTLLLSVV